jgi:hypothetical protein
MSDTTVRLGEARVTIAVGAALVAQTALGLVWAGSAAERLRVVEEKSAASAELLVRAARLEEQLAAMRAQLLRIETKIEEGER